MGMFSNLFGSSAAGTGSLISGIAGGIFGNNASKSNKGDATYYMNQTKWNPGDLNLGGYNVSWGQDGRGVTGSLNPGMASLQSGLFSGAGSFLGGLNPSNNGINPYLSGTFDQYNQMAPGSTLGGISAGQAPNLQTNMGDQFNNTAQGFLGGLGSFDPNQAASDYTNILRQQAQPDNQQAAQDMAQNLFNTGRLGSTGGATLFGKLAQAQNQQDLGFQLAGRQYAGSEQSRLAGLGAQFGQLGTGINQSYAQANNQFNNDLFNRQMGLANAQYDQTNNRAQQRFQNAMSLFGAGQQNLGTQYNIGTGLLGAGNQLDSNMLSAINSAANLEAIRSQVNSGAYTPLLQASIARNNQKAAGWMGAIQGANDLATSSSAGLGSIFDMYTGGGMMGGGGGFGGMGGFG